MKIITKHLILLMSVIGMLGAHPQMVLADDKGEFLNWNFKIGGEERVRYEFRRNFDFSNNQKDNGGQLLNRFKVNLTADLTDEYLNKVATVFIEGLDARDYGYQVKATSGQTDRFDLHQAFVTMYNILGSDVDVKLGRQELNYGEKRLIASPTWLNAVRSWDGAVIHYHKGGLYSDLIYGQNVQYQDEQFNTSSGNEILAGIYSGYQATAVSPLLEWYYLDQNDSRATSLIRRETAGGRIKIKTTADSKLDIEVPYQWGRTGTTASSKIVRAYAFHANFSKDFAELPWTPQMNIAYDEASGTQKPNSKYSNTFVPLYQTVHEPYGELDFFRWQNVRNPEFNVIFSPTAKFRFTPQVDFFWLQSKNDSWYNSAGTVVRTKLTGVRNPYVGTETSLRFYYDFTANIKLETGYAHFFSGGFVKDTGANDDADWIYSQLTLKF